jgi:hypothetical protein
MKVALTMDDLPVWPHDPYPEGFSAESITDALVRALAKAGISGVFAFSNSWALVRDPTLARVLDRWVQAGHHVANHTHRHPIIHDVSAEAYEEEIALAEKHLDPWLSQAPRKFFRYTLNLWGDTEEKVRKVKAYLDAKGYSVAEVTTWFYEWDWNHAYWNCLLTSDRDGIDFLKRTFLEFSLAQLKYDHEEATKWFGREISGVILAHNVPFFAEVAEDFFGRLRSEGVEFIPLTEAAADPVYQGAASLVSTRFLVYHQKLADARGKAIPQIAPGFETTYTRIRAMGENLRPKDLSEYLGRMVRGS